MQSGWVLLTASLTSLAFAVEPQISSVAALSSQEILLPVSAQSRTPIVPVSAPITFVKATATAPPFFGTLSRKLFCSKEQGVFQLIPFIATSTQALANPNVRPTQFSTEPLGKWPRQRHPFDIPQSLLYLTVLKYGLPVDPGLKGDVLSNLALIVGEIDHGGNSGQVLSTATITKSLVDFQYAHRSPLSSYEVSRAEILLLLETIGGLTVADGPRSIQQAFISRGNYLVGQFALIIGVPVSQNTSAAIAYESRA